MNMHDEKKWEQAVTIATAIRDRKKSIAGDFLWIGEHALMLRDEKLWTAVSESWDEFVVDNEVGLGFAPSSIRNLIALYDTYIASSMLTSQEAQQIGWHKLQTSRASIRKIAISDRPKAKEVLMSEGKIADIKRDLRELVPEADRKPLDHEEKALRGMSKAWGLVNNVEMEGASEDFIAKMQDYISKVSGYLRR